jgi:hypothetical protein
MALVCCKWCGDGCSWCGKACGQCCGSCSECNCTSFPWTLSFTVTLFGVEAVGCAAALGVAATQRDFVQIDCNLTIWHAVQIAVALAIAAFALYVNRKIRMESDKAHEHGQINRLKRYCNFFLYDVVACIFFVVLLFAACWFVFGWIAVNDGACAPPLRTMLFIANILSIIWPIGCLALFCLSAICSCCGTTEGNRGTVVDGNNTHNSAAPAAGGGNAKQQPQYQQPAPQVMMPATNPQVKQPPTTTGGYSFPSKY